jgi:Zn-finger nucleic acid-binding protein
MAYRDERPMCPSCQSALVSFGSRHACEQCKGVLVPAADVQEMLLAMTPTDLRLLDERMEPGGADPDRGCPTCTAKMTQYVLEGVTIDRCIKHGIWFDGKELATVLERDGMRGLAARVRYEPKRPTDL